MGGNQGKYMNALTFYNLLYNNSNAPKETVVIATDNTNSASFSILQRAKQPFPNRCYNAA